jgi:hypothetical protein
MKITRRLRKLIIRRKIIIIIIIDFLFLLLRYNMLGFDSYSPN